MGIYRGLHQNLPGWTLPITTVYIALDCYPNSFYPLSLPFLLVFVSLFSFANVFIFYLHFMALPIKFVRKSVLEVAHILKHLCPHCVYTLFSSLSFVHNKGWRFALQTTLVCSLFHMWQTSVDAFRLCLHQRFPFICNMFNLTPTLNVTFSYPFLEF